MTTPDFILYCVVAALGLGLALGILVLPGVRQKGLPPGPSTLPFIGNIHQIPKTGLHLWLSKCARKYGPLLSLKIGPSNVIVLSSGYYMNQLLEKRSLYYSDRPVSYVVGDQVYGGDHPMLMNADERWRLRRKLYFQLLQESRCNKDHLRIVEAETAQMLRDICLEPESIMHHPGRFSNSVIMSLVYGIRTPSTETPHYKKLQRIMTELSAIGEIGSTPPVDAIPFTKYLPERFWRNWRTRTTELRAQVDGLYLSLIERISERRKAGDRRDSFVDRVIDKEALSWHEIAIMCGNLMEGGTDTMATTTLVFLQAMATNPDIQDKAQAEIDSVVDASRAPTWDDFDKLPYITQVIKELLRWRPPAPSAFPHTVTKDDIIDDMKIPANSTVIVNLWGLHHDPARYSEPEVFKPSRFEGKTAPASVYANAGDHEKRDHYAYGTGRRICPGIHLAERGLFHSVAKILWGFRVSPRVGPNGRVIPIDCDPATGYKDGFLNHCNPFEVDVTVRTEAHRETIMSKAKKAEQEVFSVYM
ncbi:cytochrome P450 2D18 [Nemania serpens]|nr:cytochrome P450 2D18 [Nemania serpens]